ncbi:MAG: hypothetical protein PV340_01735 [Wolbachia sp.]|nr:hypothetical protein [Wolbachia sp.]MDD9336448.1 hypothetical protein [Wolbachia sp.]
MQKFLFILQVVMNTMIVDNTSGLTFKLMDITKATPVVKYSLTAGATIDLSKILKL